MAGSGLTGFLQNFGGGEFLAILIVALVVLGPDRLPDFARSLGKGLHKLRTMTDGMQSQVRDVIDDPAMQPLRELGEFAVRPRQKLAEYALEAEAEERSRKEAESVRQAVTPAPAEDTDAGPATREPAETTDPGSATDKGSATDQGSAADQSSAADGDAAVDGGPTDGADGGGADGPGEPAEGDPARESA